MIQKKHKNNACFTTLKVVLFTHGQGTTAYHRHLDGIKEKYRKEIIMKKTMIRTFYINEARKAEGKPFKTIGETYILNGF